MVDIDYNKYTLYFLSSLPSKDELNSAWIAPNAGGKGSGPIPPGPTPPGPTPPGPEPETSSFKAYANRLESILGTTRDANKYERAQKRMYNVDILVPNALNTILKNDKVRGTVYVYYYDLPSTPADTSWKGLYNCLGNAQGVFNGKKGDFENITNGTPKIGDILTFVDNSGQGKYVGVYAGDNMVYCGDNYDGTKNYATLVKTTLDNVYSKTSSTKFMITRITQQLINRHTGSPLN